VADTNNNLYYGNVLYGNSDGIYASGGYLLPASNFLNNTYKNNISVGNTTHQLIAQWGAENDGTMGSGNVYTYNCFGAEAASFIEWGDAVHKSTYDAWETAYGGTTSSVEADPLFTNAAGGDFTLQAGSPCIDAGVNLGTDYQMALAPGSTWP